MTTALDRFVSFVDSEGAILVLTRLIPAIDERFRREDANQRTTLSTTR
jgi:hypothetical protein